MSSEALESLFFEMEDDACLDVAGVGKTFSGATGDSAT